MGNSHSRMLNDIYRYSPKDTISRWNLQRISYVICLVILLEVVNLFDSGVRSTPYLLITSCLIIVSGVILLPLSLWIMKHFDAISSKVKQGLYVGFWSILPTVVAFSFFVRDAEANRPPLNLLIIIGLISMVPILNGKETLLVFLLPALGNFAAYAMVNCNVTYMLYSVIFCLAGILITVVIHRQYIFLIRELNHQMLHDALTKLLSRRAGMEQAERLLSVCKRNHQCFVAIMMDIDFFKSYNDSKGHLYGDEVLQKTSGAIQASFARGSDVVFRYGGEEFCACCSTEPEAVGQLTDRLMQSIRALDIPAERCDASDRLTISLGVSVCRGGDKKLEEILRQADEQLHVSKESGRNRFSLAEC